MTDQATNAAQSRDRRRVHTLAEKMRRAVASIDLMLDGMTEREKLLALNIALERQLQIDKGLRHVPETISSRSAGGRAASATLDRSGRQRTAPPAC